MRCTRQELELEVVVRVFVQVNFVGFGLRRGRFVQLWIIFEHEDVVEQGVA